MKNKKTTWIIIAFLFIFATNIFAANSSDKPYVILISFDGFRWDYPHRGITPNLKKMAENGVTALSLQPVFPSKTFPNHYSIITGLYPVNHGIIHNDFYDPFSDKRYKVGKKEAVRNAKWYQGEAFWETAERQEIITASYFWPGSELNLKYRQPTYFEYYDHDRPYEKRIADVINWLMLPELKRPHFITLYFDATDTYGHRYGPDSPEINKAIQRLDDMLGLIIEKLDKINLLKQTNIIVVSDHGMASIDSKRIININKFISDFQYNVQGNGPVMMIDCAENQKNGIFQKLKQNEDHFKVYLKDKVPNYFHFSNHPFISPIIIIAEPGWSLMKGELDSIIHKFTSKGNHGYDNHHIDMHGIFYASGPAFKKGYRSGTLWNIDIYPLLCKILGIFPRQNIDGKLERIKFILKE